MPTYEYECEKCKKIFEVFQSMKDSPLTTCNDDVCKGPVHRLLSGGAGFLFKGSGFYITDYRSDSYKKAKQSEGGASSGSAAAPASSGTPSGSTAPATSSSTTSSPSPAKTTPAS